VPALFCFVQFEFTHAIGPSAGRYIVANAVAVDASGAALRSNDLTRREHLTGVSMKPGTADVLAISIIGAPARQRLRRRARSSDPGEPAPDVPLLLATFIRGTEPLDGSAEAERLLDAVARDEDAQQDWVADGLEVLNRAIRAYRAGARDPYVTEVAQRDARAVRIGYGTSDHVADGDYVRAITLPPPVGHKPTRTERLAPSETTADVLAGRGRVLEGEDVLLRAYIDLDHGRLDAATQQVRGACELLARELAAEDPDGELETLALRAADAKAPEDLERLIASAERIVERWRYAALVG